MGRNKFSQKEIEKIGKLLRLKNAGTRYQQKMIRHTLRVDYEFNISDFNVQGKPLATTNCRTVSASNAFLFWTMLPSKR